MDATMKKQIDELIGRPGTREPQLSRSTYTDMVFFGLSQKDTGPFAYTTVVIPATMRNDMVDHFRELGYHAITTFRATEDEMTCFLTVWEELPELEGYTYNEKNGRIEDIFKSDTYEKNFWQKRANKK